MLWNLVVILSSEPLPGAHGNQTLLDKLAYWITIVAEGLIRNTFQPKYVCLGNIIHFFVFLREYRRNPEVLSNGSGALVFCTKGRRTDKREVTTIGQGVMGRLGTQKLKAKSTKRRKWQEETYWRQDTPTNTANVNTEGTQARRTNESLVSGCEDSHINIWYSWTRVIQSWNYRHNGTISERLRY